jgi:serine O-acetyltransferase
MSTYFDKAVDHESHVIHWDIASIVAQLRALRSATPGRRLGDRPVKLPSQKALEGILDGLSAALFPNRLGLPDLTNEGVDYFGVCFATAECSQAA